MWYARDISKKVKTGIKTKGASGKPVATEAPYDYIKGPNNKDFWIFKTEKHYKDKRNHYVDKDKWQIIENVHEPIIDRATYENVQHVTYYNEYAKGKVKHPKYNSPHRIDVDDVMEKYNRDFTKDSPVFSQ